MFLLQRRVDRKYLNLDKKSDILFKGVSTWEAEETTETNVQTQTNSVQSNSNQFSSNQINYYNHKDSFLAPTVEQVRQYAERENLPLDPTQFVDYYAANGWLLGKRPMRDWKAAARNWARKITAEAPKQPEIILAPLEDPYGSIVY